MPELEENQVSVKIEDRLLAYIAAAATIALTLRMIIQVPTNIMSKVFHMQIQHL
jgi:hypothetical protein